MELTNKEREAVEKSIRHWEEDFIQKFDDGLSIDIDGWKWNDGSQVKTDGKYCKLCSLYSEFDPMDGISNCSKCPYQKFYGRCCDYMAEDEDEIIGHWAIFMDKLNRDSAIAMRDALKAILEESK